MHNLKNGKYGDFRALINKLLIFCWAIALDSFAAVIYLPQLSRTQDGEIGKIKKKTSKRKNIKRKIRPNTKQCNFNNCEWNKVIYCQGEKKSFIRSDIIK